MSCSTISRHDFDIICEEILNRQPASFDHLCACAEKLLLPYISRKIRTSRAFLQDQYLAGDIMQDVHIKILRTVVTHFGLSREKNETDLTRWMFVVAHNTIMTHLKKSGAHLTVSFTQVNDDGEEVDLPIPDKTSANQPGKLMELRSDIAECFRFAIDFGSMSHITLTYLMIMLISLETGCNRIEAERLFVRNFADRPLDDIQAVMSRLVHKNSWLGVTEKQLDRCADKLNALSDGQRTGDRPMRDFSMKKGLEASISDWLNRMDKRLRAALPDTYQTRRLSA